MISFGSSSKVNNEKADVVGCRLPRYCCIFCLVRRLLVGTHVLPFMTIAFLNAAGDWFAGKMNQPFRKVEFNLRPKLEPLIEKAGDAFTEEERSLLAGAHSWSLVVPRLNHFHLDPAETIYFHNWGRFEGDIRLNVLIQRTERRGYDDLSISKKKDGYEICYSPNSTSISRDPKPIVLGTIPYKFFEVMQSDGQYDSIIERKLDKPLRAMGWTVKDDESFLAETDFLYMRWRILE